MPPPGSGPDPNKSFFGVLLPNNFSADIFFNPEHACTQERTPQSAGVRLRNDLLSIYL